MIETDEQRRWWFATHPEFSWSHKGGKDSGEGGEKSEDDKVLPEDVDAYVDHALKHVDGPVADLLRSVKRNFGTEGTFEEDPESEAFGWDVEAGGRLGPRGGGGRRRREEIRDRFHMTRGHRQALDMIEAELGRAGANPRDYQFTFFRNHFVAQRNSTFNPVQRDRDGRTNIERMEQGLAPYGRDGKAVVLHHLNQMRGGPLIELTTSEHNSIPVRREPSQINRSESGTFRESYWQARAQSFRNK
ncbi:MAG: HNH/ENDO VII family nuclease [Desulfomonile tiedjei]|nr:HNH/ENDO VII family nuclease [Desulfomonile tiedjei]